MTDARIEGHLTRAWAIRTVVHCPWTEDNRGRSDMKSQDILLLLKLVSIQRSTASYGVKDASRDYMRLPDQYRGWEDRLSNEGPSYMAVVLDDALSARGLADSTGISKSEVSNALKRCTRVGLAKVSRKTGRPTANTRALGDFIVYGLRYVFPPSIGTSARGIPTGISAPIVKDKLLSSSTESYVWEDRLGREVGTSVSPLYRSVPYAVRRDPDLYAMLALVDSIRMGMQRESKVAEGILRRYLDVDQRANEVGD